MTTTSQLLSRQIASEIASHSKARHNGGAKKGLTLPWKGAAIAVAVGTLSYLCFQYWRRRRDSHDDDETANLFLNAPTTTSSGESKNQQKAETVSRLPKGPHAAHSNISTSAAVTASFPSALPGSSAGSVALSEEECKKAIDAIVALLPQYGGKVPKHLRPGYVDKKGKKKGNALQDEKHNADDAEFETDDEEDEENASTGSYQTQLSLEFDIAEQMVQSLRDDVLEIGSYAEEEQQYLASGTPLTAASKAFKQAKRELGGGSFTLRWLETVLEYLEVVNEQRKLLVRLVEEEKTMSVEDLLKRQAKRIKRRDEMDHEAEEEERLMQLERDDGDDDYDDYEAERAGKHAFLQGNRAGTAASAEAVWKQLQAMGQAPPKPSSGPNNKMVMDWRGSPDEDEDEEYPYDEEMDMYGMMGGEEGDDDYDDYVHSPKHGSGLRDPWFGYEDDDEEGDEEEEGEEYTEAEEQAAVQHFHHMMLGSLYQVHALHFPASGGGAVVGDDAVVEGGARVEEEEWEVEEEVVASTAAKRGGKKHGKKGHKRSGAAKQAGDEWVDY